MFKKLLLFVFFVSILGTHSALASDADAEMQVDSESEGIAVQENKETIDSVKSDNEKMATDKKGLETVIIHMRTQNKQLNQRLVKEKAQYKILRLQKNKVEREAAKIEAEQKHLDKIVTKMRDKNDDQQTKIEAAQQKIKLAAQDIAKLKKEQKTLIAKKARQEKTLLRLKAQQKLQIKLKKTVQTKNKTLEKYL